MKDFKLNALASPVAPISGDVVSPIGVIKAIAKAVVALTGG